MPGNNQKPRKKTYRRSTPVLRLRRNIDKIGAYAELCAIRLRSWNGAREDARLLGGLELAGEIQARVADLRAMTFRLERSHFVPARKSTIWQPSQGDHVRVVDAYRSKYAAIYASLLASDPHMLDDLVVQSTLPTGEIIVKRRSRTPFALRKSHICQVGQVQFRGEGHTMTSQDHPGGQGNRKAPMTDSQDHPGGQGNRKASTADFQDHSGGRNNRNGKSRRKNQDLDARE